MTAMPKLGRYALIIAAALMLCSFLVTGARAAPGSAQSRQSAAERGALSRSPHSNVAWRPGDRALLPLAGSASSRATGFSFLYSVYCTDASKCWAVGEQSAGLGTGNLVMRWNGTVWRKFSAPNPGGTGQDSLTTLFAVRCLTSRDCWAVGEYGKQPGAVFSLALHWNGTKWSRVATPSPAGRKSGDISELYDVTCVSSASCWAVGDFGFEAGSQPERFNNLAMRWNGTRWSQVRTPNPGGVGSTHVNSIFSVRCASATRCDAVGDFGRMTSSTTSLRNQALHWNGTKWTLRRTPNPAGTAATHINELDMLGCTSASNCWGAGFYGTQTVDNQSTKDEAFHWNGRRWSRAIAPHPGGTVNELFGVMCRVRSDCWAVGEYAKLDGGVQNQAAHWNGSKWSLVPTPNPASTMAGAMNELFSVRCTSHRNCWAVGFVKFPTTSTITFEILHWNGTNWSIRLPKVS